MSTENPNTNPTPTPAPAPVTPTAPDTANPNEVDQLKAQLAAQVAELDEIAKAILSNIPDGLKALIPEDLSPAAKVKWYQKAQAAGLLIRPQVPETDTSKPGVLPVKVNPDDLPPIARMSYGYGTK